MACTRFVTRAVVGTLASCCLIAAPTTAAAADPSGCGDWLERVCAGEQPDGVSPSCLLGFDVLLPAAAEPPCNPYVRQPPWWPVDGAAAR